MKAFLPLLFMAGCCAPPQTQRHTETVIYRHVKAIEYRDDGSLIITYETGRVTVLRNGIESEAF